MTTEEILRACLEKLNHIASEVRKEQPVIFEDTCERCGRQTTHRSWIDRTPESYLPIASTTMITFDSKPLKTCLSCGLLSWKE